MTMMNVTQCRNNKHSSSKLSHLVETIVGKPVQLHLTTHAVFGQLAWSFVTNFRLGRVPKMVYFDGRKKLDEYKIRYSKT